MVVAVPGLFPLRAALRNDDRVAYVRDNVALIARAGTYPGARRVELETTSYRESESPFSPVAG